MRTSRDKIEWGLGGSRGKGSGWQVELGLREEAVVIAGGIGALE
ncbi:hypothetical protein [Klebsiella pneumoniae]|nr:hypothetical protein [Klebsiella pneumoniae]